MNASVPSSAVGVWNDLVNRLGPDYQFSNILFHPAYVLLSDAILSYDASAFQATCAMCRAATEAACYIYLTRRYDVVPGGTGGKAWLINTPLTLDGKPRDVSFGELLSAIRDRKVLTDKELNALRRIQEDGNFAVHAAARQDRDLHRKIREPNQSANWLVTNEGLVPRYKVWASPADAYRDLLDSASIVAKLVKAAGPWREPSDAKPPT